MSVTFWCPAAPTIDVIPYPEDEPTYVETRSVLPEVNLNNSNAALMLSLLRCDSPDLCGSLEPSQFDIILARLAAMQCRVPASEPAGASTFALGVPADHQSEYVQRTAARLEELFLAARKDNYTVSWG